MSNSYNKQNLMTLQESVRLIYEKIVNAPGQYFIDTSYERGYIEGQLEILKIMLELIEKQKSGASNN